jgi:hypothetical protein
VDNGEIRLSLQRTTLVQRILPPKAVNDDNLGSELFFALTEEEAFCTTTWVGSHFLWELCREHLSH